MTLNLVPTSEKTVIVSPIIGSGDQAMIRKYLRLDRVACKKVCSAALHKMQFLIEMCMSLSY